MIMASQAKKGISNDDYQALQLALQDSLGVVVSDEGRDQIAGKLQPLMSRERLSRLTELAVALRDDASTSLRSDVLEAISTHTSQWFAYPEINRLMCDYVLPSLQEKQATECRIWLAGCRQGQSAYSLAMALDEYKQQLGSEMAIEIVATDSSASIVEKAESAIYSDAELEGMPQSKHRRYLDKHGDSWQVNETIRSMLHFKAVDVLEDSLDQGHFDVIVSPDLLIYFSTALKSQLLDDFASLLEPAGILILGTNESVLPFCKRFDMVDHDTGVFYRQVR